MSFSQTSSTPQTSFSQAQPSSRPGTQPVAVPSDEPSVVLASDSVLPSLLVPLPPPKVVSACVLVVVAGPVVVVPLLLPSVRSVSPDPPGSG